MTISQKSLSFTKDEEIDLKLNQKPARVSTYNWCTQKAKEHVLAKKRDVLRLLGIHNKQEWSTAKKNLPETYYNAVKKAELTKPKSKIPLSKKTKESIYNIIKHPYIQKVFGITGIRESKNSNQIIAERGAGRHNIFFEHYKRPINGSLASTIGCIIKIADNLQNLEITSETIEALLCHELAHVLREHTRENWYLQYQYNILIYEKDTLKIKHEFRIPTKQEFKNALNKFIRAYEIEADIVAGFNNPQWTRDLKDYFSTSTLESSKHPPYKYRTAYLAKMYLSMQNSSRPKKPTQSRHIQNTQKVKTQKPRSTKRSIPTRPMPKPIPIYRDEIKSVISNLRKTSKKRHTNHRKFPRPNRKHPSPNSPSKNQVLINKSAQSLKHTGTLTSKQNTITLSRALPNCNKQRNQKQVTPPKIQKLNTQKNITQKPDFIAKFVGWCRKIMARKKTQEILYKAAKIIAVLYFLEKITER